jgi:hypothetical protein
MTNDPENLTPTGLATPEVAAGPEPLPEPSPLEIRRREAARSQPPPWHPSDDELDPDSEAGWEVAAKHELLAIRPEDLPAAPPVGASASAGALTPPEPAPTVAADAMPAAVAASYAAATAGAIGLGSESGAAEGAPSATATMATQPAVTALAPSPRRWRRRLAGTKGTLEAAARPLLLVALFGFGGSLGWWTWVRSLPPPESATPPPATETGTTNDVPVQVASLIAAINSDNQTQLQVVIPDEPYRTWAGELKRRQVQQITGARALATYANGSDTATEILVGGNDTSGNPVLINLVVHIHDGQISALR